MLERGARKRDRAARELVGVGARAHGGGGGRGKRVQSHRDLEDRAERAERAREQLGQVVAGHVLDHLAAALRDRAVGERHAHPHHQVARPAVARPQRTRVAAGQDAAERRAVARRVEGQHLPRLRERLLGALERHARLEHGGEVAGVVLDDAVEPQRRELPSRLRASSAPVGLGAGARDPHGTAGFAGGGERLRELLARGGPLGRPHQKRSATPACSSGWRRYGPGTSPHSRGAGITLPGFARCSGSNAQRRRWNADRSGSSNIDGM